MPNHIPPHTRSDLPNLVPIKRALISVSDKTGLLAQAHALHKLDVSLISTGGTAEYLRNDNLPVIDVAELTGFEHMMDGRVKTLHPAIHGALLADRAKPEHQHDLQNHNIEPIDLLIVNLYPFERTQASDATYDECVENIDIGGPAMIRAAAKNHSHVTVCTDAEDVDLVLAEMQACNRQCSATLRQKLAAKAYGRTAAYDTTIANYLTEAAGLIHPTYRSFSGKLQKSLRYGENPHQSAALYADGSTRPGIITARQLQGKALSYNNINDADAAYELIAEFGAVKQGAKPTIAIIKHANPCGVACADDFVTAYQQALACDSLSAFGSIIALNGRLGGACAREIVKLFTEVVIAPDMDSEAQAVFAKKKNIRLLITANLPDPVTTNWQVHSVAGGLLVQSRDTGQISGHDLQIVTKRQPDSGELADMLMAWKIVKHVKSNAVVYVKNGVSAAIGAGQMSRVDAAHMAAQKAQNAQQIAGWKTPRTYGSACASDAFFPFADGLHVAADAGASAIIQPGGSIQDDEIIAAADAKNLTMAFTNKRHFRH